MYRVSSGSRLLRAAVGAGLLSLASWSAATAQTGTTITGTVTVEGQGTPLSAIVTVPQHNATVQASAEGRYSLRLPSVGANASITITARALGHTPVTKTVTVSSATMTVDFQLKPDPFRLSDVVVTGTTDGQARNKIPFSVARVGEEALREVPAGNPVGALAGKVAGARIGFGTGNPGSEPTIRLRGSTSLAMGGSSPLIIVDGVITRFSIADIDAQDIESIEVLKGAAASAFYGSDAANGVLAITTKRGGNLREGTTRMSVRSEMGTTGLQNWVPLNRSHEYLLDGSGNYVLDGAGNRTLDPDGIMDNPYPTTGAMRWRDQLKTWINDGDFYTNNFQLGFRRGSTNLNTSFTSDHNSGLMPGRNGQFRQSMRLNVDQQINDKADFSTSVTYSVSNNDYGTGSTAGWFALLQAPPDVDLEMPIAGGAQYSPVLPAYAGNSRGNPLYQLYNESYSLRRERMLASATARYRPLSWLRLEGTYGTDRSNRRSQTFQDKGYLTGAGLPGPGSLSIGYDGDVAENIQASAVATRTFFDELLSTTRAVYLYEKQTTDGVSASGNVLGVKGTEDLNNVPNENNFVGSGATTRYAVNYFIAQSLDWRDRYILDVLVRRDGSSLFGSDNRWANFYRVAAAWRFTEDFQIPGVQDARVRYARGTAGLRPGFSDQYETYSLSNGVPTAAQVGNSQLKPAVQTEDEFGLNVAFLDRFEGELVYSKRFTEGAFLSVPLSQAQTGGFTSQVQNAADVSANTIELALNAIVLEGPNYSYSVGLVGDRTRQKIDRLGRAPYPVSIGQGQDVFYYKEGETLGVMYGTRFIRTTAELEATGLNPALYTKNSDGYMVLTTQHNTAAERPVVFRDTLNNTTNVKIGDVNPDFTWGLTQTARWRGLQVYALIDGVKGGDVYNMTKQWMYQDHRHGTLDQSNRPVADRRPYAFYDVGLYNGLNPASHFVEDGSYVRLRELSVSYSFDQLLLSRAGIGSFTDGVKVSLVGRNLYTWTKYTGFDPEANAGGDFNFRIDGFRYPNFRTVTAMIEVTF